MNGGYNAHKVLFAGGGTAGHLMPAINIALEMQRIDSSMKSIFVGRKGGMEAPIVAKFGFQINDIDVVPLKRNPWGLVKFLLNWREGQNQAAAILREFDPAVIVGSGGYVSAPVVRAAHRLGKPIYLQEQNSLPGLATRTLSKMASAVFTAYESAAKYLPPEKCRLVGNPLRPDLLCANRTAAEEEFGLNAAKKTLLVLGGSSGAARINRLVLSILNSGDIPHNWQVLWQTGQKDHSEMASLAPAGRFSGRILPFIDNMPAAYAAADLVLSRAGAMALAEMAACGLPSVLIPYPHATGDHQSLNARQFADSSAAIVLPEPVSEEKLASVLKALFTDESRRKQMAERAGRLAKPEAGKVIARTILDRINEIQKN